MSQAPAPQPPIKMPPGTRYGDIAVTLGYVSREQAEEAARLQREDPRYKGKQIGEVMVAEGYITKEQQERIAEVQKELRERLEKLRDPAAVTVDEVAKMIREINEEIEKRTQEAQAAERRGEHPEVNQGASPPPEGTPPPDDNPTRNKKPAGQPDSQTPPQSETQNPPVEGAGQRNASLEQLDFSVATIESQGMHIAARSFDVDFLLATSAATNIPTDGERPPDTGRPPQVERATTS